MKALELKIPPPVVALLVGLAMWSGAHLMPAVQITDLLRFTIAGAFAGSGFAVSLLGFLAFRRAKTTVNPVHPEGASSLVTGGVYQFTRNPMYVGLTAVLTGWAVWLEVPWTLLGPVALILYLTRFQIVPEERVLTSKFGRDYDEYCRRVRRWL